MGREKKEEASTTVPLETWIDYVDGDIDPSLKEDLTLMLSHSKEAQAEIRPLQYLFTALEKKIEMPSDDYFKKLEGRIMSRISEEPTPLRIVARSGRFGRPAVQMMLSAAALVAVLCAPLIYSSIRHATSPGPQIAQRPLTSEEKMMVEASRKDLKVFSDIIN